MLEDTRPLLGSGGTAVSAAVGCRVAGRSPTLVAEGTSVGIGSSVGEASADRPLASTSRKGTRVGPVIVISLGSGARSPISVGEGTTVGTSSTGKLDLD